MKLIRCRRIDNIKINGLLVGRMVDKTRVNLSTKNPRNIQSNIGVKSSLPLATYTHGQYTHLLPPRDTGCH